MRRYCDFHGLICFLAGSLIIVDIREHNAILEAYSTLFDESRYSDNGYLSDFSRAGGCSGPFRELQRSVYTTRRLHALSGPLNLYAVCNKNRYLLHKHCERLLR